jgi:hypothetical protein
MRNILIVLIALACISACSKDGKVGDVQIRLSNTSDFDFEDIVLNTSTGDVSYGSLNSRELSSYKTFEVAYSYAFIELTSGGNTYTLQPIDYVGETPLEKGKYTYQLDLEAQGPYNSLLMILIED